MTEALWQRLLEDEGVIEKPEMDTDMIWGQWVQRYLAFEDHPVSSQVQTERNRREHAAQAERNRQALRLRLSEELDYDTRHANGMATLRRYLSKSENALLARKGIVDLDGSDGKRYRVYCGESGITDNVWEIDEHGCEIRNYCGAPDMYEDHAYNGHTPAIPLGVGWLGQILTLKYNAREFLRVAYGGDVWPCDEARARRVRRMRRR